ncbi:MAG: hypothetical protein ABL984_20630 [Pyrinomonadaceae bacterium]
MKIILVMTIAFAGIGCWTIGANSNNAAAAPTADTNMETPQNGDFLRNLPRGFEQPNDDAGRLLLREYGAVFLARGGATPPKKVVYKDEADVVAFQNTLERSSETIGGTRIELQTAAMDALKAAISEAAKSGLNIGPRGADSARRGYDQTVSLWASRVNPGFAHWVAKGRVKQSDATRIKSLPPYQQVPEILGLESQGIFFAKSLDKSIIYSVAPPGTSQHLSMLALDVKEFDNAKVREILAKHKWFQTVSSDLPHFTFLGVEESKLADLGLKKVINSGRAFWVPAI